MLMSHTPKILYIATHCPFGESYGAQMRTLQVGRLLQRVGSVTMVLASVGRWSDEAIAQTRAEFDLQLVTRAEPEPIRGITGRLRHEFDPRYLNTHGFAVPGKDAEKVFELANSHDVVWLHTLRVANLFRRWKWERSVLDIDDFVSQYHATMASRGADPIRRLVSARRAWLWQRRERDLFDRFDAISVCSEEDKGRLAHPERVHVLPNGFDDPPPVQRPENTTRLGVVGRLDYPPNRDGVEWFLQNVWPAVRRRVPDAEFRIVGTGANDAWRRVAGVSVLGYVDDTSTEIASWAAMVVPLRAGAGTRVKIAEAFARTCPVISTRLGAFGYEVESGRELLLADTPEAFANACIRVLHSKEERARLAEAGRSYFASRLRWDALVPRVEDAIGQVCPRPGQSSMSEETCLSRKYP